VLIQITCCTCMVGRSIQTPYRLFFSATASTQSALASHARQMVEKVKPDGDQAALSSRISRELQAAIPPQVYYYNYFVGECKDITFGVSLSDYATSRVLMEGEIPRVVRLCIDEVEERGMQVEGIYRISGRHAIVQNLQHKLERNEREFKFDPLTDDIHAVASLLKV
jgi:hypothetical protein